MSGERCYFCDRGDEYRYGVAVDPEWDRPICGVCMKARKSAAPPPPPTGPTEPTDDEKELRQLVDQLEALVMQRDGEIIQAKAEAQLLDEQLRSSRDERRREKEEIVEHYEAILAARDSPAPKPKRKVKLVKTKTESKKK